MENGSVIIVEDDEITALNLKISLQKHGYEVIDICDNAEEAKESIENKKPNIVIVDISLQESDDGIELAQTIRDEFSIPFIFLTSYSDDEIISKAKKTEPYGYIVKPFDPNSLHATIQMAIFKYDMEKERKEDFDFPKMNKLNIEKLLYSKREGDESIVRFGKDYHIDINASETYYKDKKIRLTKKENAFLRLLVAQLGLVVTFQQAMEYVWEESGATENSVRTLVWRLRNKLETDIIKNASGIGYYIDE